jgi:hypothetical protein
MLLRIRRRRRRRRMLQMRAFEPFAGLRMGWMPIDPVVCFCSDE